VEADTYLGERRGVQAVLAGDLQADRVASLGIPGSLGTSLDLSVDAVVVAGSEDRQVVAGSDSSRVLGKAVANGRRVLGDGGLLNIIATLGTDQETLMAQDNVQVGSRSLQEVEESTSVQVGLLEVQVELSTLGLGAGQVLSEDLSLQALGNVVVQLELGVEGIGSSPGLGESEAYQRSQLALQTRWSWSSARPTKELTEREKVWWGVFTTWRINVLGLQLFENVN
jgi:hypothetical protein